MTFAFDDVAAARDRQTGMEDRCCNAVRQRNEWKFFSVLPKADRLLAILWWLALVLRGALPAVFAVAMGVLVGAVNGGQSLTSPLIFVGTVFILLQVLTPIHQAVSANLGDRTAAWLYGPADRGMRPPCRHGASRRPEADRRPHRPRATSTSA